LHIGFKEHSIIIGNLLASLKTVVKNGSVTPGTRKNNFFGPNPLIMWKQWNDTIIQKRIDEKNLFF